MCKEICEECKYHECNISKNEILGKAFYRGWHCINEQSDYYGLYTGYTDTCDMWEQRGVE